MRKDDEERLVRLSRMNRGLKVIDFVLEDGNLRLIGEDKETVLMLSKSKRREVFDEALQGSLAGHFTARNFFC